ncbi:MAG TPA: hypothetical protein VGN35_03265 [Jatrophihabitantaceae bacterium]|nr:hypothetical protein [Jatrophihabitantaceae bacterium]
MTRGGTTPADGPDGVRRIDNGLFASSYVPLTDVAADVGSQLLSALGRARIAAYLDPAPDHDGERRRLFVASAERADARTIVAAAARALGQDTGADAGGEGDAVEPAAGAAAPQQSGDPLDGVDTDAAFADLIADWHVDTIAAVRDAERELRREDADWRERLVRPAVDEPVWLDDDHYVPPPPPPLPRLAAPTIGAMALLAASILLLGLGGAFGLATDLTMLLGVLGVLLGAWMLVMRLRDHPDDEDDDGAVI